MDYLERFVQWCNIDDVREELLSVRNDTEELKSRFGSELEFGTAGMRGIMGAGTNRMNNYTVGFATQGLANYLKINFPNEEIRVAIAHDSRNNSRTFAEHVADIFASNGFKVFLFDELRPTPELSFAIRELHCQSGVMVTASHNPKEYNGYKAYWTDGGQMPPESVKGITDRLPETTYAESVPMDEQEAIAKGLLTYIGPREIGRLNTALALNRFALR